MTTDLKFPSQAEIRAYEQAAHELRAQTLRTGVRKMAHLPKAAIEGLRTWAARPTHA